MKQALLFDLDGTLTKSEEGILRSVQYALRQMGRPIPPKEELIPFIGPPLIDSFMHFSGMNREEGVKATTFYRERFSRVGIFENELYPGVMEMLQHLSKAGFLLATASSKPEPFVRRIVEHFKIAPYFTQVVGATFDGRISSKATVVAEVLRRLKMETQRDEALLVGDTHFDVDGARAEGVDCAAVSYGYGTRQELEKAQPKVILSSVKELEAYLLAQK
ncbi:MAG: HAD hydrolase-like protein [Acidaminococcus sp.]|jgi:phosphoglycolate phosphatase|nr:HAD hydrolase-like protein [Acidaminococcus sp.]MCI2100378.1 HAD hydrolase-like protein [Acidaminococcus sp.]MCI2114699.1 HAD hydrolase-like protein [Acidaminococcus sp.]MCI2116726.1 HAD hydrolase-like protein [Acidaminococcus sp.]